MRKGPALGLAAAALLGSAIAAPSASAECPAETTCNTSNLVSVQIVGGGLSISASTDQVDLEAGTLGAISETLDGQMPLTTVSDNRGTFVGWTVTAKTDGDMTPTVEGPVIDLGDSRSTGPLTISTSPLAVVSGVLPATPPTPGAGRLNPTEAVTLFTMPAVGSLLGTLTGGGSYSFTPSLSLAVPASTPSGTYTTTVTQTVV